MADQPDPPDEWRVYEGDPTPDPEPPDDPPKVPYGDAPQVPYGGQPAYNPVIITTTSRSAGPKLVIVMVAVAVLGVALAGAIAIFAAVDSGVDGFGIGGIDAKDPENLAEFVDRLEEERGSTEVFSVGLYDGYIIAYVPVDETTASIAYRWDGGDLEEWTKSTSSDHRFDVTEIDADVIAGMCDPVLELAEGATEGDCYIQIRKPGPPFGGEAWFSAGASDEYGRYYSIGYDINGDEVSRTLPQ